MSAIETPATGGDEAIGQAILQMERLYRTITGKDAPSGDSVYSAIPAEKDPARHVEEQLDRLMNVVGRTGLGASQSAWTPPLSVWETEREVILCLDLPGVSRDAVTVQIEGNLLTVSGERKAPSFDGARLSWSERPQGDFRRTVLLPQAARNTEPTAQVKEGQLEIRIPREPVPSTPAKTVHVS